MRPLLFLKPTPFDLQRARQKREMAARLRQVAPGLSIASERTLLLRDAEVWRQRRPCWREERLHVTPPRRSPISQSFTNKSNYSSKWSNRAGDPEKPKP